MERAAEGDNSRTAGGCARDFHRVLDRLGAGREEGGFHGAFNRHQRIQTLRKVNVVLIRHDLKRGMGEARQLLLYRRQHFGMPVAGIEHSNAGGEINIFPPLLVPQRGVFGFRRKEITHHAHATRRGL